MSESKKKPEIGSTTLDNDKIKSEIKNPTSEIKAMEVHHHPHLEHKAKPWKEYLLEGFMIFVAVTMGFFAETIREGISDRSKGHEYIRSFVEDMQRDTTTLAVQIAYDNK